MTEQPTITAAMPDARLKLQKIRFSGRYRAPPAICVEVYV